MAKSLELVKKIVLIQIFESCPDLRMTGSNIYTGRKAFFHVNGRNQGYKIYMTNTGKSVDCYIKQNGRNVSLKNDALIGSMSPYRLENLVDWYIEVPEVA